MDRGFANMYAGPMGDHNRCGNELKTTIRMLKIFPKSKYQKESKVLINQSCQFLGQTQDGAQ